MARPPAGPIGNSPRDVRDDAIGAPPDVIKAGEPLKKTRKPIRVKSNTFHAKVSGNTPPKRADRAPTFRRGGWVSGYASGGFVAKPRDDEVKEHRERSGKARIADAIEDKREDMPGVQKNDTSSDQNLRGKPVKFEDKPVFTPSTLRHKAKLADGGIASGKRLAGIPGPPSDDAGKKKNVPKYQGGGGVQLPGKLRSESTELAQARRGFEKNPKDTDAALKMIRTEDETGAYLPRRSTGEGRYQGGGGVKKSKI